MNKISIIIVVLALAFGIFQYTKVSQNTTSTIDPSSHSTNITIDYSDNIMEDGVIEQKDSTSITNTTLDQPVDTTKSYTIAEVSLHSSESDCYTIINSKVYDVTSYIKKHPGGDKNILKICGKDGTSAFEGQHGGQYRPEQTLQGFEIGILK